ncbi:galactokinase [Cryptococcus bacillisporus CA1873]|uniref:Galactokinase n=1 Tax=Cryptococcus bacillisporus CA1873 TaxID=1296111 RepID=A0ABR5B8D4_CRYGA|nr:galactokinase [Cryptococcus bacillisporus CA1873]|eukprot:KIR59849.1 galactokinase [Cryptococcus gattii CA1873]
MSAKVPIPVFKYLQEIYPSASAILREGQRWNALLARFQEHFGEAPTYVVRAPGRVNVLGEHIDYSLFPVLPAAIEQDILFAFRPTRPAVGSNPTVRLENYDRKHSYPGCSFSLIPGQNGWDVGLDAGGGWDKYVRAALLECLDELFPVGKEDERQEAVGMNVLISGNIPPGSGLSSSAAMVVGSVIMFLVANNMAEDKTKADVVQLAINSEHRMGLRTGGMDQSASALALPNNLLHLSFYPSLLPSPLPLPGNLSLVITNSLAPHSLTESAPEEYNLRVIEILIATRLILHHWKLESQFSDNPRPWLREVLGAWVGEKDHMGWEKEGEVMEKALGDIEWMKRDGGWSREEMVKYSGMDGEVFKKSYLEFLEIRAEKFYLYERLHHTLTESLRVHKFVHLCQSISTSKPLPPSSDTPLPTADDILIQLGKLFDASHASMRDTYDCTHPLVDSLQELCLESGAIGSRMTGGGWGGSVVSLVESSQVAEFLEKVRKGYEKYDDLEDEEWVEIGFATMPGHGAGVYVVEDGVRVVDGRAA